MRAAVGDWLRTSGRNVGQPQRTCQIIEIRGADGEPPYLVRFSDGRTSLVVPGPGAVIEHSKSAHAPDVVRFGDGRTSLVVQGPGAVIEHSEPAHGKPGQPNLIFRVTASQRRALAITVAILTALATASGAAVAFSNPSGRLTALAAGVGLAALLVLYYAVAYAVAYTECTPAGLRVRGVARRRFLPWDRLRDIAVRDYASSPYRVGPSRPLRIVIVTALDGSRFWLSAPIDGGQGLGDPQFEDKIRQIQRYWHSARSRKVPPAYALPGDNDPAGPQHVGQADAGFRSDPVPGRALAIALVRACRTALLIFAVLLTFFALPITARDAGPALNAYLGHGQHGTFTAQAMACPRRCLWYGDFVTGSGRLEYHVLLADGGTVTGKGHAVPAIDVGRPGMVYPASGAAVLYPTIALLLLETGGAIYVLIWTIQRLRRWRMRRPRGRPRRSAPGLPEG